MHELPSSERKQAFIEFARHKGGEFISLLFLAATDPKTPDEAFNILRRLVDEYYQECSSKYLELFEDEILQSAEAEFQFSDDIDNEEDIMQSLLKENPWYATLHFLWFRTEEIANALQNEGPDIEVMNYAIEHGKRMFPDNEAQIDAENNDRMINSQKLYRKIQRSGITKILISEMGTIKKYEELSTSQDRTMDVIANLFVQMSSLKV